MRNLFSSKSNQTNTFADPAVSHGGSEFEVNKWTVSEFVVKQLVPTVGVHPFPLDELMLMTAAVCKFKPAIIFEWGTNIGKSARIFYEVTKAFNIPAEIHSIDLPDDVFHNEHPQNNRGMMVKGLKEVVLHQADGVQRSIEILSQKGIKDRVLFFVDGDHSYESVKKELSAILKACPEAAVLLHDTFYQSKESGYNIGPNTAIKEVLETEHENYRTVSTGFGLPGMTLVYKS